MKRCRRLFGFFLCLFPVWVYGGQGSSCKTYPSLASFDMSAYRMCMAALHRCPAIKGHEDSDKNLYAKDLTCVDRVASNTRTCQPMIALADLTQTGLTQLTVTRVKQLTMVNVYGIADGAEIYYVVTPQGCLINTAVLPSMLTQTLSKKYPNVNLWGENYGVLQYRSYPDGAQRVLVPLRISVDCRACKSGGFVEVGFYFAPDGSFVKKQVIRFESDS